MTYLHQPQFISKQDKRSLLSELAALHPIHETRYTANDARRDGQTSRLLLRPVYWLGGWQFACHNYYRKNATQHRVVLAEPLVPTLRKLVQTIEKQVKETAIATDIPTDWKLNTCLINYYGNSFRDGRWVDTARVNNHKDHEPGPVASLSLGAAADFDFNLGGRKPSPIEALVLKDRSLLAFWGAEHKDQLYHRVRSVRAQQDHRFDIDINDFRLRRINITLRYVPDDCLSTLAEIPNNSDLRTSVQALAAHSSFWQQAWADTYGKAEEQA